MSAVRDRPPRSRSFTSMSAPVGAPRIQSCVRPADTVARLGGDEFAVLPVEHIPSVGHVDSLAHRLLEVLQLPIDVLGVSLAVPASVGPFSAMPTSPCTA